MAGTVAAVELFVPNHDDVRSHRGLIATDSGYIKIGNLGSYSIYL